MSSASYVRERGWGVGTVLYGYPIVLHGQQVEGGVDLIITGIGQEAVLGIGRKEGSDRWWSEGTWQFESREWRKRSDRA